MKLASLIPLLLAACDVSSTENNQPYLGDAPEIVLLGRIQAEQTQLVLATGEPQRGVQPIVREGNCFLNDSRVSYGFPLGYLTMTDPTKTHADLGRRIALYPDSTGFYTTSDEHGQAFSELQIATDVAGPLGAFSSDLMFPAATQAKGGTAVIAPPNVLDPTEPFVVDHPSVNGSLTAVVLADGEHAALCFAEGRLSIPRQVVATFATGEIWIGDAQLEEQQLGPTDVVTFALQGRSSAFATAHVGIGQ